MSQPAVVARLRPTATRACLGTFLVLLALASPADAATLLVNGSGILLGAEGVNVGGTLYDVEFVDGTCIALFDGCDLAADDFTFTTQAAAARPVRRCWIRYSSARSIPIRLPPLAAVLLSSATSKRRMPW